MKKIKKTIRNKREKEITVTYKQSKTTRARNTEKEFKKALDIIIKKMKHYYIIRQKD